MKLKYWIENYRTDENKEFFNYIYERGISLEENTTLESYQQKQYNLLNYICGNKNTIENYMINYKDKEYTCNLDYYYDEDVYFFFKYFEYEVINILLKLLLKKETEQEYFRIRTKYEAFLNDIKKLNDNNSDDKIEYAQEFKNNDIVITDHAILEHLMIHLILI